MKTALALRHVNFEHLGMLETCLEESGYRIRYADVATESLDLTASPDLLVVLGGPLSVNDTSDFPFLAEELKLVEQQLARKLPLIGICLGAQLMACALGSRVYSMRTKEIGWSSLVPSPDGSMHALQHLCAPDLAVLHWHGETFDLPASATRLAGTEQCENQAFSVGRHALGLQFHVEVTAQQLESWLVGHVCELNQAGISIPQLRADGRLRAHRLEQPLRRFWTEWLRGAAASGNELASGACLVAP